MKKVLFVFPQWHFNIVDTLKGLREEYDVHTLHFHSADEVNQLSKIALDGVTLHPLKLRKVMKVVNSEFFIASPVDLWKKLDKSYDRVIFKNIYDTTSLMGFLFCRLKGIPFAFSEQKIKQPPPGLMKLAFWFIKEIYLKLLRLSTVPAYASTGVGYKQLAEYAKKRKHIPFAIDVDKLPQKKFRRKKTVDILCVSKFQERKDQLLLIEAVQGIKEKYPKVPIRLTLVGGITKGNAYVDKLKAVAKQSTVPIEFIEKIPREKIHDAYLDSDLFVLASYDEPAAYSHLEAMAYGLPAICSSENGTANYIKEGENGYVFKARNKASLQKAIEDIILTKGTVDWKRIEKFGKNSRKLAQKNHSPQAVCKEFKEII